MRKEKKREALLVFSVQTGTAQLLTILIDRGKILAGPRIDVSVATGRIIFSRPWVVDPLAGREVALARSGVDGTPVFRDQRHRWHWKGRRGYRLLDGRKGRLLVLPGRCQLAHLSPGDCVLRIGGAKRSGREKRDEQNKDRSEDEHPIFPGPARLSCLRMALRSHDDPSRPVFSIWHTHPKAYPQRPTTRLNLRHALGKVVVVDHPPGKEKIFVHYGPNGQFQRIGLDGLFE